MKDYLEKLMDDCYNTDNMMLHKKYNRLWYILNDDVQDMTEQDISDLEEVSENMILDITESNKFQINQARKLV